MNDRNITRRDMLATTVGAIGAASMGACGAALAEEAGASWDEEYDVVILGAGGAGLAAAIESAKAGASTVVYEREPVTGGDTVLCGGVIAGNNDFLSKEKGIEVSNEEVRAWWDENPNDPVFGPICPDITDFVIEQAGITIDWLHDLGVEFQDSVAPDPNYTTLPVIHLALNGGRTFGEPLLNGALDAGAEIVLNTRGVELLADESTRIVGVVVENLESGEVRRVKANRAVVLATGGFSANPDMIYAFNPDYPNIGHMTAPGVLGEGLTMAMRHGAIVMRPTIPQQLFPSCNHDTGGLIMWHVIQGGGIVLSDEGKRFMREDTPNMTTGGARYLVAQINKQANPFYYMVAVDSPEMENNIDFYGDGFVHADSVEELAEGLGIDPAVLKDTLDTYNGYCEAGEDPDFGRAEFLVRLDPPFYGARCDIRCVQTLTGLKINAEAQVMRMGYPESGLPGPEPIPGLFAAGEVVEWNAHAGWTVGMDFSVGRLAGQKAAATTWD